MNKRILMQALAGVFALGVGTALAGPETTKPADPAQPMRPSAGTQPTTRRTADADAPAPTHQLPAPRAATGHQGRRPAPARDTTSAPAGSHADRQ